MTGAKSQILPGEAASSVLRSRAQWARDFVRSATGRRWIRGVRAAFVIGVVGWLAYRFSHIGWRAVWEARPRSPWFYVIWLASYLQLAVIEALIYRAIWTVPVGESFLPLLRKRTLNQDVLSGLGEAYLFLWARRRLPITDGRIAGTIKDNLISASLGAWTSLGVLILVASPMLLTRVLADRGRVVVAAGALVAMAALGVRFRRSVFTLPPRTVLALVGVHFARFALLVYGLQVLQWWVVVPGAALYQWIPILVVVAVVNRMPFIPARDLTGLGAVLGVLAMPPELEAPVAAMLLVRSTLDRGCNLALFLVGTARNRGRPSRG